MNLKTLKAIKAIFGSNESKLPVLNYFYVDPQYLYFTHLGLSIRVKHYFPFKEGSPAIVVDAINFIARTATIKAPYHISSDHLQRITFTNAESESKMKGFVPEEYPLDFVGKDYKELFAISGSEIRLMNIARGFTADDALRPVMEAVCISKDYIVSSDAHKLYYRKITKKADIDVLIDPRVLRLMMLACGASFVISCDKSSFRAESDDMTIYWRSQQSISNNLIDSGGYPNWKSVIPKTEKQVVIPITELMNGIKSISFAINSNTGQLVCDIKGDILIIEGKDLDNETSASEKISIVNMNNAQIRFGLKAKFLNEILKMFKDEGRPQITMAFNDETNAFVFGDTMLLMPVMLHESF